MVEDQVVWKPKLGRARGSLAGSYNYHTWLSIDNNWLPQCIVVHVAHWHITHTGSLINNLILFSTIFQVGCKCSSKSLRYLLPSPSPVRLFVRVLLLQDETWKSWPWYPYMCRLVYLFNNFSIILHMSVWTEKNVGLLLKIYTFGYQSYRFAASEFSQLTLYYEIPIPNTKCTVPQAWIWGLTQSAVRMMLILRVLVLLPAQAITKVSHG